MRGESVDAISEGVRRAFREWLDANRTEVLAAVSGCSRPTRHASDDGQGQASLVKNIQGRGWRITAKELQRSNGRKYQTSEAANAALDSLVSAGLGRWADRTPGEGGGRPTRDFHLTTLSGIEAAERAACARESLW